METQKKAKPKTRTIQVNYLARVEGEGGLYVKVRQDQLKDVKLKIFEPPRFFEAFLKGRDFREAPDITARICGICPIAYQLGASHAMEEICGVKVDGPIRELRRLIYCGEWIESHVLHMFMLHAPDFLGYQDVAQMAKDYPEVVRKALRLKKIGNNIMTVLGGREIHPINLKVGGFYRVPDIKELSSALLEDLKWGLETMVEMVKLVATFPFHDFEQDYEFLALHRPDEYAIIDGRLSSNKGIDAEIKEYDDYLIEEHVQYSTALQTRVNGRGACFLGPMARYSRNFGQLTPLAQETALSLGLGRECRNPFKSIIVRGIETLYAFEEALRVVESYEMPDHPAVQVEPMAGTGYGATEAPRGICYHRYTTDDRGIITDAKIVSPTAVNQKAIENDLWNFIPPNLHLPNSELQWQCEQAIRNYDPCISCSTHFLRLDLDRQ